MFLGLFSLCCQVSSKLVHIPDTSDAVELLILDCSGRKVITQLTHLKHLIYPDQNVSIYQVSSRNFLLNIFMPDIAEKMYTIYGVLSHLITLFCCKFFDLCCFVMKSVLLQIINAPLREEKSSQNLCPWRNQRKLTRWNSLFGLLFCFLIFFCLLYLSRHHSDEKLQISGAA